MKYILQLIILLVISTKLFPQNQASAPDIAWGDLKTQMQNRADLSNSIAKLLSNNNKIDKRKLQVYVTLANDLFKYIDTLKDKNKSSLATASTKNNALTKSVQTLLILYEDHPKFKQGEEIMLLQMQLEGCENKIAVAKKKYNDSCKHFGRADLCLDL